VPLSSAAVECRGHDGIAFWCRVEQEDLAKRQVQMMEMSSKLSVELSADATFLYGHDVDVEQLEVSSDTGSDDSDRDLLVEDW
jgi:hypothetical protein